MNCKIISSASEQDWIRAKESGLLTQRKRIVTPPNKEYKRKLIKSEHSPLTTLYVTWEWNDMPYYVSNHFVRHHVGITHFVSSQRNDTNSNVQNHTDRKDLKQDAPVNHRCVADYLSVINISRKRMCGKAAPETQNAWLMFLNELKEYEPVLVEACVPNCVYRGGICAEFEPCKSQTTQRLLAVCYPQYKNFLNGK